MKPLTSSFISFLLVILFYSLAYGQPVSDRIGTNELLYRDFDLHERVYPSYRPDEAAKENWGGYILTTAVIAGAYTGLYYQIDDRWDNRRVPFFFNDQYYAKGLDKLSHFYVSYGQALIISRLYGLAGMNEKTSSSLGFGIALSVQTIIEVLDGTRTTAGFDRLDQLANIAGVSWFFAQERIDALERFNFRAFYYPSNKSDEIANLEGRRFSQDYSGFSYWVSMRTWDLLPPKLQSLWPRFLVPAAGITLNNWPELDGETSHVSYHLSINLDFKHILPQESAFSRTLTDIFNSVYIPAPALEVYPNPSFKLIFYGQN